MIEPEIRKCDRCKSKIYDDTSFSTISIKDVDQNNITEVLNIDLCEKCKKSFYEGFEYYISGGLRFEI